LGQVALERAPANHLWTGSDWVHQDSAYARSPAVAPSLIQPTALRSLGLGIGGLTTASVRAPLVFGMAMSSLGRTSSVEPIPEVEPEEDAVMAGLQRLRASLLVQQDAVYSTDGRSHDEMAAQDAEWEELDNKIHAIEALFMAFGVVFRTR
jgi:hypothetical protein